MNDPDTLDMWARTVLPDLILDALEANEITQTQLAKDLGLPRTCLTDRLHQRARFTVGEALYLTHRFHIPLPKG